jgi:transcriptional regulator with XRE-family HTH domain
MPIIIATGPNVYQQTLDLIGQLPDLTQTAREARGLTVKQAAAQVGIGSDTLASFEAGSNATKSTLLAILGWLSTL